VLADDVRTCWAGKDRGALGRPGRYPAALAWAADMNDVESFAASRGGCGIQEASSRRAGQAGRQGRTAPAGTVPAGPGMSKFTISL